MRAGHRHGELAGDGHLADLKTLAGGTQYARPGSPVEARQEEVAREHLQRAEELGRKLVTPEGVDGPMTKEMKSYGSRVLVPVIGAFAGVSPNVEALADVTALALAADHVHFFSTGAEEAKGMYKQRNRTAWGHAAHRGWARLLLGRCRDLIVYGPQATRNAGGKSDDEDQQWHDDNHYHYHYPEQFHARASD